MQLIIRGIIVIFLLNIIPDALFSMEQLKVESDEGANNSGHSIEIPLQSARSFTTAVNYHPVSLWNTDFRKAGVTVTRAKKSSNSKAITGSNKQQHQLLQQILTDAELRNDVIGVLKGVMATSAVNTANSHNETMGQIDQTSNSVANNTRLTHIYSIIIAVLTIANLIAQVINNIQTSDCDCSGSGS